MSDKDLLEVIKYNLQYHGLVVCACGEVHPNYSNILFKCLGCQKILCNGESQPLGSAPDNIKQAHQRLSKRCVFFKCDHYCSNGYCLDCFNNKKTPMPGCDECGVRWCCWDHMTCTC